MGCFARGVLCFCLLGTIISLLGGTDWTTGEDRPYAASRASMLNLVQAIDTFVLQHGSLPDSLAELTRVDPGTGYPLMDRIAGDAWGTAFLYRPLGNGRYQLRSCGADGLADTEDDLAWPESGEE